MYAISHQSPLPLNLPEMPVDFRRKSDNVIQVYSTYYLYDDAVYPWDPAVLRSIREFDEDFIPATVRRTYHFPTGGEITAVYFAGLRYKPITHTPHDPFDVTPGQSWLGPLPNIEEIVFEDEAPREGWPGRFVPCTAALAFRLKRVDKLLNRSLSDQGGSGLSSRELALDYIQGHLGAQEAQMKALKAEAHYRFDHDWNHIKNNAEKVSSVELKEGVAPPSKKPFVDLGDFKGQPVLYDVWGKPISKGAA